MTLMLSRSRALWVLAVVFAVALAVRLTAVLRGGGAENQCSRRGDDSAPPPRVGRAAGSPPGGGPLSGRELLDALGLVVDLERDLTELVGVLLAVVGAEEELEAAGQGDADVRLGAAPVAPVGSSQLGTIDD